MSVSGLLAGMAGATDLLGATHSMTTSYGTTVGFDCDRRRPARADEPDRHRARGAAVRGAAAPAPPPMQIQAGIPAELVDVLQATILFFLVISPVIKRIFRLKRCEAGLEDSTTTFTATYGGEATIR